MHQRKDKYWRQFSSCPFDYWSWTYFTLSTWSQLGDLFFSMTVHEQVDELLFFPSIFWCTTLFLFLVVFLLFSNGNEGLRYLSLLLSLLLLIHFAVYVFSGSFSPLLPFLCLSSSLIAQPLRSHVFFSLLPFYYSLSYLLFFLFLISTSLCHSQVEQLEYMPFDPIVKRTEGTIKDTVSGKTFKTTKGAPHVLLKLVCAFRYSYISIYLCNICASFLCLATAFFYSCLQFDKILELFVALSLI